MRIRVARTTRHMHRSKYQGFLLAVGCSILFGLLIFLHQNLLSLSKNGSEIKPIQTGRVMYSVYGDAYEVPYYHCASSVAPDRSRHLVLLHGARFTKEDWKSSGIVETLCKDPQLSVSAMDLSIKAGHKDISGMLTAMKEELRISLPVTLVTPSASGMGIMDWMSTGRLPDLPKYVRQWIPIACFAVSMATEDQLARLSKLEGFQVFAMYGSEDRGGMQSSAILEDYVGARSLELQGGHSCYLDSPNEFCTAIVQLLG